MLIQAPGPRPIQAPDFPENHLKQVKYGIWDLPDDFSQLGGKTLSDRGYNLSLRETSGPLNSEYAQEDGLAAIEVQLPQSGD